jgi:hypothetical protein
VWGLSHIPSFGVALRAVKRYMNEGKKLEFLHKASAARFRVRIMLVSAFHRDDFIAFKWSVSRKKKEKIYRMGV